MHLEPAAARRVGARAVGDFPWRVEDLGDRFAAVNDSCVIDSRKPSDAIGQTRDSIMVMNATSVPIVTGRVRRHMRRSRARRSA